MPNAESLIVTFLLAGDAARELKCSTANVRRLERVGRLPAAAITPGGVKLYAPDVVKRLAAARRAS